jgi:glutamate 5-kinase
VTLAAATVAERVQGLNRRAGSRKSKGGCRSKNGNGNFVTDHRYPTFFLSGDIARQPHALASAQAEGLAEKKGTRQTEGIHGD